MDHRDDLRDDPRPLRLRRVDDLPPEERTAFDYHEVPDGTERDPATGRLRVAEPPAEEDPPTGPDDDQTPPDPELVLRVNADVLAEARTLLESWLIDYDVTRYGLRFRTAAERDIAEALLAPINRPTARP